MTHKELLDKMTAEEFARWVYKNLINDWVGEERLIKWLKADPTSFHDTMINH